MPGLELNISVLRMFLSLLLIAAGGSFAQTIIVLKGVQNGFTTSPSTTNPTRDISISPGVAGSDDGTIWINPTVAITKRINATWALGNNLGGLDQGTIQGNKWYYPFVIKNTTTQSVDILISLSPTSPTMPTGFTKKQRIGSFRTNAAAAIIKFKQSGDWFWNTDASTAFVAASPFDGASFLSRDVYIRASINAPMIPIKVDLALDYDTSAPGDICFIKDIYTTDASALWYAYQPNLFDNAGHVGRGAVQRVTGIYSDSAQIDIQFQLSIANPVNLPTAALVTLGWDDIRGR